MNRETEQKIHAMLYSNDKEMQLLGVKTLEGTIQSYKEFKQYRGRSIKGKPFFSFGVKMEIRQIGRTLRKQKKHFKDGKASNGENMQYAARRQRNGHSRRHSCV